MKVDVQTVITRTYTFEVGDMFRHNTTHGLRVAGDVLRLDQCAGTTWGCSVFGVGSTVETTVTESELANLLDGGGVTYLPQVKGE